MTTSTHPPKIGVVGAGLIGRAWAMVFARAGLQVKIFDADAKALSACMGHIETLVQDMRAADLVQENPSAIVQRITPVNTLAEVCADVDLIQENIRETVEAKIDIFIANGRAHTQRHSSSQFNIMASYFLCLPKSSQAEIVAWWHTPPIRPI